MHRPPALRTAPAAALLLIACGPPRPELPVDDPRGTAIGALKADPEYCPFKRAEYCLEDMIEPAIEAELASVGQSKLKGQLPTTDRKLERFIKSAQGRYRQLHFAEAPQRNATVAKMKAHYDAPPSMREGDQVYVDLGVLPTGLQEGLRTGWVLATTGSPLLDGFHWSGKEIAAKFLQARAAHPDATRYNLKIVVPKGTTTTEYLMAWEPAADQIAYTEFMSDWATRDPLGPNLEAVQRGDVHLFKSMLSCTPGDGGHVQAGCPAPAAWPGPD